MVDIGVIVEDIVGAFSVFRPAISKLIRILTKRSRRKGARESAAFALSALLKLQESVNQLMQCGERILELLDKTKVPTSVAASMKLYDETVTWVNSSADMMLALAEVVEQAEFLTRNPSFMRELEDVDEQTFEFVKLLARSKKGDALDFSELPTYTAIYLRHERQRGDVELGGMEAIEAYIEKATKVGETLAPPFRTQQARLRRAFDRMSEAGKVLAPIPQRRLTDLRNSSSGLAIIGLDLVDAGLSTGLDISPRKVRREPSPLPPPKTGHKWQRGDSHRRH